MASVRIRFACSVILLHSVFRSESAGRRGSIIIKDSERTITLEIPEAMFLYRLSYDPQRPNRLFISGQRKGGDIFSRAYAPGMNELVSLTNSGVHAYKGVFWDGVGGYAKRLM